MTKEEKYAEYFVCIDSELHKLSIKYIGKETQLEINITCNKNFNITNEVIILCEDMYDAMFKAHNIYNLIKQSIFKPISLEIDGFSFDHVSSSNNTYALLPVNSIFTEFSITTKGKYNEEFLYGFADIVKSYLEDNIVQL